MPMPMPHITVSFGGFLIILGLGGFAAFSSPTALIPAGFGLLLALCGALASRDHLRKHAMHAAVVIALLGFFGTVPGFLKLPALVRGEAKRPNAVMMQMVMGTVCLVFTGLCVKSFVDVRRKS